MSNVIQLSPSAHEELWKHLLQSERSRLLSPLPALTLARTASRS